jgi:DNA polymerase III epsilon subunit-like protein
MANPYRKSDGKYTTRFGQIGSIHDAIDAKDYEGWAQQREALANADELANHRDAKSFPVHPGLKDAEAEIKARDALIAAGSREEIEAALIERIDRPEFVAMLTERDEMRIRAKLLKDEYDFLKDTAKKDPNFDYQLVRAKGFELRDTFDDLQVLKYQVEQYKDITAPLAARATELQIEDLKAADAYPEYTAKTLNDLEATVEVESGSREWLEARQHGWGGSDIGRLTRADRAHSSAEDYEQVIRSKIEPITDEEVEAQAVGHNQYSGAAGQGNAWEERIALMYAARHPEANITHCKTSWQHKEREYQLANFDGLMTDENGVPNGILEIKTAADGSKWGDEADGIGTASEPNIPPNYRAQILWYMQAANLRKGAIAVLVDNREYKEYHYDIDKEPWLQEEMEKNRQIAADAWELKKRRQTNPSAQSGVALRKGFGVTIMKEAASGKDKAFADAAVHREETVAQTKARFAELVADPKDPEQVRAALTKLYTEKNPAKRNKKLVFLDIEFSGSPSSGRIIELGYTSYDPKTGKSKDYSKLFGVGRKMERIGRTGASEVHGIKVGMVKGKRQFSHPEVQKEIMKELKGSIMVVHNQSAEVSQFNQHLDGFYEAMQAGDIQVLDTMLYTQRFLPETEGNKLRHMVEGTGGQYVNAHRALNDAKMTKFALMKLWDRMYKGDQGKA